MAKKEAPTELIDINNEATPVTEVPPSDINKVTPTMEVPSDVAELRCKIIQILNNVSDGMLRNLRSVSSENDLRTIKTLCDSYELLRSSV